MLTQSKHTSIYGSHGAIVLRDCLSRSLGAHGHDMFVKQIDFWQDAISGKYKKMNLGKREQKKSRTLSKWYQRECELYSYKARVPEERFLIQKVQHDPYHYLVNLIEMVVRKPIEEMLRSEGMDVTVFLASEHDNILSGVDIIIEEHTPKGVRYTGIDIAITKNPIYIKKKEERTKTICLEFNTYKKHEERKKIPRQVFAIPPIVMAKFLLKYMNEVCMNREMKPEELLSLFPGANNNTTEKINEKVQSEVHNIMHEPV